MADKILQQLKDWMQLQRRLSRKRLLLYVEGGKNMEDKEQQINSSMSGTCLNKDIKPEPCFKVDFYLIPVKNDYKITVSVAASKLPLFLDAIRHNGYAIEIN